MQERVVGHVSGWVGVLVAEVRVHGGVGAVPTAAGEGEEGPATRQVPYGRTAGTVHTSGN